MVWECGESDGGWESCENVRKVRMGGNCVSKRVKKGMEGEMGVVMVEEGYVGVVVVGVGYVREVMVEVGYVRLC